MTPRQLRPDHAGVRWNRFISLIVRMLTRELDSRKCVTSELIGLTFSCQVAKGQGRENCADDLCGDKSGYISGVDTAEGIGKCSGDGYRWIGERGRGGKPIAGCDI